MVETSIPTAVGDSYDPTKNDYVAVKHARVGFKVLYGWVCCGEVTDPNSPSNTLVVMEKPK